MRFKYFKLIGLVGVLLAFVGCASPGGMLIGTWEMLDENGESKGKTKILSEDHFAFGSQTGPKSIWAGGGTWVYYDGVYIEVVQYHSAAAVVGKTLDFDCRVEDGIWYHEGWFEAGGENFHVDEVWRKLN